MDKGCNSIDGKVPMQVKHCAYYNSGRPSVMNKWTFFIIVLAAVVAVITYYVCCHSSYNKTYELIQTHHKEYCENILDFEKTIIPKDSLLVINNDIILAIKEENKAITSLLDLQYNKINNDFDNLTLWASILMVVFLIFSIYAMYKMEEMQNRGSESLSKIYDSYMKGVEVTNRIEELYKDKTRELEERTEEFIKNIQKTSEQIGNEIKAKKGNFEEIKKQQEEDFSNKLSNIAAESIKNVKTSIIDDEAKLAEFMRQIEQYKKDIKGHIDLINGLITLLKAGDITTNLNGRTGLNSNDEVAESKVDNNKIED